jgi:hypothetical protein
MVIWGFGCCSRATAGGGIFHPDLMQQCVQTASANYSKKKRLKWVLEVLDFGGIKSGNGLKDLGLLKFLVAFYE